MSRLLSSILVAAALLSVPLVSAGSAQAAPRAAEAQRPAGLVLVQDRGRWEDHRRPGRGEWRDRHHDRRGGCGPRQALRKAERMGVRGADIERVGRRAVTVSGWRRGELTLVRFAQVPGCPVIGRR